MADDLNKQVVTVLGPVDPAAIGWTLMHEHVFIDATRVFYPPEEASLKQFEHALVDMALLSRLRRRPFSLCRDNVVLSDETVAIQELDHFAREGGTTLVDCTMVGIGRDPRAVRRVARACGLHIVQGTGAYVELTHPDWVEQSTVDQLAARFTCELVEGIDDTGIRAGIIGEIGTSGVSRSSPGRAKVGDLTVAEEKVLRAAGRASVATGAAVSIHLDPRGQGAFAVFDILSAEGVAPDRIVMCHMDANPDLEYHLAIAERGVYVEYDHFGREYYAQHMRRPYTSDTRRIELLSALLEAGYERQLLLSQDVCAKIDLCAYGGVGYAHIVAELPARRQATLLDSTARIL